MSEPGGGGEDGSAGLEVSAVQNVADVSVLQKHLRKLVPLLLEDGGDAPAALEAALEEKSALEQMRKFLSDPQVHTVLVERSTLKGARLPLPGRVGRRGCPDRQRPHSGVALSMRLLKMAELGGDGVSRARPGIGPHPCLQSHMGFSVSIPGSARFGKDVSRVAWVLAPGRARVPVGWRERERPGPVHPASLLSVAAYRVGLPCLAASSLSGCTPPLHLQTRKPSPVAWSKVTNWYRTLD